MSDLNTLVISLHNLLVMTTFVVFAYTLLNVVDASFPIQQTIQCNETINASINQDESHYYELNTNNIYDLHFDDCLSQIDISVQFLDDSFLNRNIADHYCQGGDDCGPCPAQENFIMPQIPAGTYFIHINPWYDDGNYVFSISCVAASKISCGEIKSGTITSGESKYYQLSLTNNSPSNLTFQFCADNVNIIFRIYNQLDVDIAHGYCSSENACTCAYGLTESEHFAILSNGIYLVQIEASGFNIVDMLFEFIINCVHVNNSSVTSQSITVSPFSTTTYIHYNYLESGLTIKGELKSPSDINYWHFELLSDTLSILFDSCNSSYDTRLYLWNDNRSLIKEGDDQSNCGTREQLFIPSLTKGRYVLGISGSGTDFQHQYGNWAIIIIYICTISIHSEATTYSTHPYIVFNYSMTPNCFIVNVAQSIVVNITISSLNVSSQLKINIIDSTSKTCQLCQVNICKNCNNDHDSFIVDYVPIDAESKECEVHMSTNRTDICIVSTIDSIKYIKSSKPSNNKKKISINYNLVVYQQ
eukprot:145151_1